MKISKIILFLSVLLSCQISFAKMTTLKKERTSYIRTVYKCDQSCQDKAKTIKDNIECLQKCEQYYQVSFKSCNDPLSVPLTMKEIQKISDKIFNCDKK